MSAARPKRRRPAHRPPHHRPLLAVLALALVLALLGASSALAESVGEKIILRCTHGESLAGFSQSAYREALRELSADAEEYSPCGAQIRQAQATAAGASGGRGAAGASSIAPPVALTASPSELRSIAHAKHRGSGGVSVGGEVIHPGVVHADVASALSTLPAPLLAVLALMLACLLVAGGVLLHRRVRDKHTN